jgi:hypothetical protein
MACFSRRSLSRDHFGNKKRLLNNFFFYAQADTAIQQTQMIQMIQVLQALQVRQVRQVRQTSWEMH